MTDTDKWLLGMLLILLLASIYTYNSSNSVRRYELTVIHGALKDAPKFGSTGGDFTYPYVTFGLNEYKEQFILSQCSYKSLDLIGVGKLIIGDSLKVEALSDDGMYYVFGLSLTNGYSLLDFEDYGVCNSNRWKKPFFFAVLVCVVLVVRKMKKTG
jgi:hypothetical protein